MCVCVYVCECKISVHCFTLVKRSVYFKFYILFVPVCNILVLTLCVFF